MRSIQVEKVRDAVRDMCIEANYSLSPDMRCVFEKACQEEKSPLGRQILNQLSENLEIAKKDEIPICQDTGMAVVFLEVGQEVHFEGGSLEEAVQEGIRLGYTEGYLRKSVVGDPVLRVNTGDNTPGVLYYEIVPGDRVTIQVAPKGFGSENMSALKMFTPSASLEDIVGFVIETASKAGSNPCPPMVIGVGIGGNFEHCAYLAKKALCRDTAVRNPKKLYKDLEDKMLEQINKLGIGPQGFGGKITALCVNIEQAPTHIAGLPVAVNIGCHVTRHASALI
mgnify:CR=1 FL=1